MSQRYQYFDFLRGLAITLVVGIHTYRLGEDSIVARQLLNTAVPIFVAISGFFFVTKTHKYKSRIFHILKKTVAKGVHSCTCLVAATIVTRSPSWK